MSVRVLHNAIPNLEQRELITDTVLQGIGKRAGDWTASIHVEGETWQLAIDGPDQFHWTQSFTGRDQHRANHILGQIRAALPSLIATP